MCVIRKEGSNVDRLRRGHVDFGAKFGRLLRSAALLEQLSLLLGFGKRASMVLCSFSDEGIRAGNGESGAG